MKAFAGLCEKQNNCSYFKNWSFI